MKHIRTFRTDESAVNFLECARICEEAAAYQDSILPLAESILEARCILNTRDGFLFKAKEYRELAQ